MKTLLRTRSIWILVFAPILAAVLLIFGYSAIATARRAAAVSARSDVAHGPLEEGEPEHIQKRREMLARFYGTGPGQVSNANFAASLATARALPPSPLLRDKSVVSASEQNWTYPVPPPMNGYGDVPASVRIDAIAVHPAYENTVYVGSEGGLAKSTDGGDTWTILSDNLLSQSIRSIAIDPNDPDIVYVGTGTGQYFGVGIYRSDDGGESWDLISGSVESSPFSASAVVKIVVDPNTAGSTTTTTLYASVVQSGTHSFWRSTNSGSNWTSFRSVAGAGGEPFCFYDIALNPDDPSQVYITAPDGVFMRDAWGGGSSWGQIHSQLPNPLDAACLVFAYTNPWAFLAELFLAYQDGSNTKIYKSESPSFSTWNLVGSTGGNVFFLGIDPAHPNRMFVGGYGDLRYSLNGGANWLAAGGVHVDQHSIAFCPSDAERNYLGNDGGIYRADPTASPTATPSATPSPAIIWVNKNQNLPGILAQGVSIGRDDRLFIGTQDNAHQVSSPAFPAWRLVLAYNPQLNITLLGGDGAIPFIEVENNVEKIYAVTFTPQPPVIGPDNGFPCRIIDGDAESITPPDGVGEYSTVFPAMSVEFKSQSNSDRVLMGFQNVWRSDDSGDNWTRIGGISCPSPLSSETCGIDPGNGSTILGGRITALYEAPSDPNYIYAITRDGSKILKTANASKGPDADWTDITGDLTDGGLNALAVHPEDPDTVYVTSAAKVYETRNGGTDWSSEDVGPDFIFRDVVFHPDNPDTILVASHRGVFARVDDEWGSLNANLPAGIAVVNLSFHHTSHQLAISTYGRGVYLLDLDREPPKTVSVTSPANNASVGGTVAVEGTADDNHRVVGLQFMLDGNELETEDTSAPFSIEWDTTLVENGEHRLRVTARDPYGNTTQSEALTVEVKN